MRDLGLRAYRFSTAWNRVFTEPGRLNPAGLAFYDRLVDGLLAAGIEPWLTLFHWDTPAWPERLGGFTIRAAAEHFMRFAEAVARKLGDRVKRWITVNEPLVYASLGYGIGSYAPGRRNDLRGMHHAAHHLRGADPADPTRAGDRAAAGFMDAATNRFGVEPLFLGAYPDAIIRRGGRYLPRNFEDGTAAAKGTTDFLGINYYATDRFLRAPLQRYTRAKEWRDPRRPRNPLGWPMVPEGLHRLLARVRGEYGNPEVVITENGYRARFGLVRVDFSTQQRQRRASARWYRDLAAANGLR